jgi:nucleotide sugar dehydrogenase
MEVNIVGMGVTGHATAEVLRRLGHEVRAYDVDTHRQREIEEQGYLPVVPGRGVITFFCVPEWNLSDALATASPTGLWVVRSSTRPGDIATLQETYFRHITHMPEFLREAIALADALSPDRIVIGECCPEHGRIVEELFAPLLAPTVRVDPSTSEMVKMVSNAHLSTLISFWNEVKGICDHAGVNSTVVGKLVSLDARISAYGAVVHGQPFGGFCLPKDLDSIITIAQELSVQPLLLESVREVNERLRDEVRTPELNGRRPHPGNGHTKVGP